MAAPTIPNGEEHFFVTQYEGNGTALRTGKFVPFTDNGTIANSVIFNDGDSAYLSRTPSGTGNRRTFTFSGWVKRGVFDTSNGNDLFNAGTNPGNNVDQLLFDSSNRIRFYSYGGSYLFQYITNRTFEDTSKWYHIVCAVDTTQSSASDRVKIYVDGDLITSFSTETDPALNGECFHFNNTSTHYIGANVGSQRFYDGYIAEYNFVDGTALGPDTFGVTDTSTGRWIPKALTGITYGTNGFRLQFASSSNLGDDTSGNTNDFSVTNLVAGDQTTDSPTQNFSTLEGSSSGSMTLSEGNLRYTTASSSNWESVYNDKTIDSGKWYFELTCKATTAYDVQPGVILESILGTNKNQLMGYTDGSVGYNMDGIANTLYYGNSGNNYVQTTGTQVDAGDIVGVAYDADTGAMWFAKNNTWVNNGAGVGNPSTGANPTWVQDSFAGQKVRFGFSTYNSGASSEVNFGQRSFTYTPPTDFKKLQQDNLPSTDKGITGLVWIKDRDNALNWNSYDSNNGIFRRLVLNNTESILATQGGVTRFLKGGVAVGDTGNVNNSGATHVSYNWVANNGTTVTNNDGSQTSTVQANTTAGFSVVTYAGTSSGTATIGHGLSSAPQWMIIKNLTDNTRNWFIYHHRFHSSTPQNYYAMFTTAAPQTGDVFNNTAPTSSVFSIQDAGSLNTNGSGKNYVAYCWHEVDGFSKFGKYTGTGSNPGPFIYTGFKVRWLLHKSNNGASWYLYDSVTQPHNPVLFPIFPDTAAATSSNIQGIDLLSNGFKLQQGNGYGANYPGVDTYYMAFAEHPFVGDGTNPTTAR